MLHSIHSLRTWQSQKIVLTSTALIGIFNFSNAWSAIGSDDIWATALLRRAIYSVNNSILSPTLNCKVSSKGTCAHCSAFISMLYMCLHGFGALVCT